MYFLKKCVFSLLALQASFSSGSSPISDHDTPTRSNHNSLQKRYPIQLNFDPSVSTGDQAIISTGFQEMQVLATAAANYNYQSTAGNIDGIYRRYFPQGQEQKVQAMFRYLAGISQQWGGQQLTTPDFSRFTIKRTSSPALAQAYTQQSAAGAGNYDITFTRLGMPPIVPATIQDAAFRGTQSGRNMEMLAAIVLHELLHATVTITNPIMAYGSATDPTRTNTIIDDQKQPFYGLSVKSYGSYLSTKLKQSNAQLAAINNDNFMYFALECYWKQANNQNGGFAPADVECLENCGTVLGQCLWCWDR